MVCDVYGVFDLVFYCCDLLLVCMFIILFKCFGEGINVEGLMLDYVVEVEVVFGVLMLVLCCVFDYFDGFDECYFLYCEDLDLCCCVCDVGYCVMLVGDVCVLYGKGGFSWYWLVFVSWYKYCGMWCWFCMFDFDVCKWYLVVVVWLGIWVYFVLKVLG